MVYRLVVSKVMKKERELPKTPISNPALLLVCACLLVFARVPVPSPPQAPTAPRNSPSPSSIAAAPVATLA